jgi:hypothetical protein
VTVGGRIGRLGRVGLGAELVLGQAAGEAFGRFVFLRLVRRLSLGPLAELVQFLFSILIHHRAHLAERAADARNAPVRVFMRRRM